MENIALLEKIKNIYSKEEAEFITRAYYFAKEAHLNQKRASGEDYFTHPCAVVEILLGLSMDSNTLTAALLHDVLEDTPVSASDIKKEFGEEVLELVEGVTKLEKIEFKSQEEEQAENFKKIFVSMAKDIRVIIIKLADRLHNMRSLNFLSQERQLRMANETLEIFAPLAGRLGISQIKCELEDLCLKYIEPEMYEYLSENIKIKLVERNEFVDKVVAVLKEILEESKINGEVFGRRKHFYSIYRKMKTKGKTLDQIYDLTAVRVLVDTVDECYELLGKIHKRWNPMPGRIKDYIAIPKENMYQSLHTTVVTTFGQIFEIQIRTREMNRTAEYGIAAHWQYKEHKTSANDVDKRLSWIREAMEWQGGLKNSKEFLESIKGDIYNSELLVFTPKGKVISLIKGSTAIDFAYRIHTEIGNKCVGVRINGKIMPLTTILETGNIVEIITSNQSKGPSWDWLKVVKSNGARAKIKAFFRKQMAEDSIKVGKQMLELEAKNRGYNFGDLLTNQAFEKVGAKLSFNDVEEMYAAVGCGAVTVNQVFIKVLDFHKKETPPVYHYPTSIANKVVHSTGDVTIKGVDGLLIRFARCCNPVPGDKIVGYVSRGRGVAVHREDCPNMKSEKDRLLSAEWTGKTGQEGYTASLRINAKEDVMILSELTNSCKKNNLFILTANSRIDNKNHVSIVDVTLKISKKEDLDNLIRELKSSENILDVFRFTN